MSDSDRLNKIIGRLLNNTDQDAINATYRDWAETYDQDLDGFGYVAPRIAVNLLAQFVPDRAALILDAGCGTGRCGQILVEQGYKQIDGVDFSDDMLAKATELGIYRHLGSADLSQRLAFSDQSFRAVLSVGVHWTLFKDMFIPEALRLLEPGGVIVMTCRPHYYEGELEVQLDEFARQGLLRLHIHESRPYMEGQEADAFYIVAEKL